MKNTHKILAAGSTTAFLLSVACIPTFAALEPAGGPLDDLLNNVATETTENTALKVQNLSVLPANGKATLMWDPVLNQDDSIITKYKISYGKTSVEEGLADSYDDSMKLELNADELETVGIARSEISGLKNGEKYFFVVQAIDSEGTTGTPSEEKFTTPSLNPETTSSDSDGAILPLELKEATALTNTIIKATLSKEVVLPEDGELRKKTFIANLKADEDTTLEIQDIVFKENYLQDENSSQEAAKKGTEIYIILKNEVEKDIEYQLTASARLKDIDNKSIDNGVTDNVFFTGTDNTTFPESERQTPTPEKTKTTDPLGALLSGANTGATNPDPQETTEAQTEEPLHAAPRDTVAPEDITALRAEIVKRVSDFIVNLSWIKSKNTAGDLIEQLLYTSIDNGKTWGSPKKFNGDLQEYTFTGKENTSYTVKITTKDRSGNESDGVVKTIKVPSLVSSGAPMFLALGLALMGGAAQIMRRKTM